jgi:ArsR family transcriptional regulator
MNNEFSRYTEIAEILKALAHPVRLCIVKGLLEQGECNVTYMQSCLATPQSTVSQHLQKLKSAGIITGKRNGLEINYRLCNDQVAQLIKIMLSENK